MASHKKHFSFTGLYSVVLLLPVLVMFYGFNTKLFPPESVIYLYVEEHPEPLNVINPVRNYSTFIITDDESQNELQFEKAKKAIKEVAVSNDTICGVRIVFGKKTKYNEFIRSLDMCNTPGSHTWIIRGNELLVLVDHCPPDNPEEELKVEMIDL